MKFIKKVILKNIEHPNITVMRYYTQMNKYLVLSERTSNKYLKKVYCFKYLKIHRKIFKQFSCDITPGCKLGNIILRHPLGIVVGGCATLEDGVIVHQNVTFGAARFDEKERRGINCVQVVKKNTIICAGAKILGDVTIGENCIIGANTIVTKDVPNNTVVVGYNKFLEK